MPQLEGNGGNHGVNLRPIELRASSIGRLEEVRHHASRTTIPHRCNIWTWVKLIRERRRLLTGRRRRRQRRTLSLPGHFLSPGQRFSEFQRLAYYYDRPWDVRRRMKKWTPGLNNAVIGK